MAPTPWRNDASASADRQSAVGQVVRRLDDAGLGGLDQELGQRALGLEVDRGRRPPRWPWTTSAHAEPDELVAGLAEQQHVAALGDEARRDARAYVVDDAEDADDRRRQDRRSSPVWL